MNRRKFLSALGLAPVMAMPASKNASANEQPVDVSLKVKLTVDSEGNLQAVCV